MVNTNLAKFDHALFAAQPLDPNPELHHFLLTALELHKRLRPNQKVTIYCSNSSLIAAEAKLEPQPSKSWFYRLCKFSSEHLKDFAHLSSKANASNMVLDIRKGST
jgi:hypothetical protein